MSESATDTEHQARSLRLAEAERRASRRSVYLFLSSVSAYVALSVGAVFISMMGGAGARGAIVLFILMAAAYTGWRQARAHRRDRQERLRRRARWGVETRVPVAPRDGETKARHRPGRGVRWERHRFAAEPPIMLLMFVVAAFAIPIYALLSFLGLIPF